MRDDRLPGIFAPDARDQGCALPSSPARFIEVDLPLTREATTAEIEKRLIDHLRSLRQRKTVGHVVDDVDFDPVFRDRREGLSPRDLERIQAVSRRLFRQREKKLVRVAHLKPEERKLVLGAIGSSRMRGIIGRDLMEERIAELHEIYPWMAPASAELLRQLRLATQAGASAFRIRPLLLLGPPGIAKSSWARDVARLFDLCRIDIDIGATNGATFTIGGVERGWGTANAGRVVNTMLRERTVNPLVILDELDKIPSSIGTSSGSSLPGAFEVIKSMIERSSAQSWPCPYYQIPFDISSVNWIMTTNSITHVPAPFLDRVKLIELKELTEQDLRLAGQRLIASHLEAEDPRHAAATELMETEIAISARESRRISLRVLQRMIQTIVEGLDRPRIH